MILAAGVKEQKSWVEIAKSLSVRSNDDCRLKWDRIKLTFNPKNVPFTEEEVIICLMCVWF